MREVAVVSAVRTAVGKAKKGTLKDTRPDDLLAWVLNAAVERAGVDPSSIEDIVVGTAMPEAEQGMNLGRIGGMVAGLPDDVPAMTINRFCSSGLQSLAQGASGILAGWNDVVLTAGVESMSQVAMGGQKPAPNPRLMRERPEAYTPMGITAENVASRYGISREDQDAFATRSHQRAAAAISEGRFADEILPVHTRVYDGSRWHEVTFDTDEGVRSDTSPEVLGRLRAAFKLGGSVTAGNSSQVSDGAAATLLMNRELAESEGLPILAVLRSYKVVGVPPDIMGVGPLYAIPKAVEAAGLTLDDIGLFEVNEAFASQALYCVNELGIDAEIVNVNGGAIAIGHPLGASGARILTTLVHELHRRGDRYGLATMCIGVGQGISLIVERV